VITVGHELAAGQRRLVGLVVALDASGEWALDGAPTCAHWVADALDVEVCTAREWLRVGRALQRMREIARAFEDARLSYSKVRALTRVATVDNEAELCALAERVAAGSLPIALAAWLAGRETGEETERRQREARSLTWHVEPDGMVVGTFRLPPVDAAKLTRAVDAIVSHMRPSSVGSEKPRAESDVDAPADAPSSQAVASWPSMAQQRADALVELASGGGARVETEIVLHVRADGCTLDDGTPIAGTVVERLAPDAFLRLLIHDAASRPIDASGRRRHPSARQRRLVRERDGACVDCGSTELLEYDHQPDFELTGRTVVEELKLRCRTCHRARHDAAKDAA